MRYRTRLVLLVTGLLAHFVDAAEKAGFTPDEINRRFHQIADTTVLDEFWVTDEMGHAYLRNVDVDFTFSPSALEQPQAHVLPGRSFTGEKDAVVQEARQREIDNQHFKYAAVSGVDKPRIVQVGYNAKYLADLKNRVGLGRAVQALLASGDIDAIWVFDTKLGQLAGPEVEALHRSTSRASSRCSPFAPRCRTTAFAPCCSRMPLASSRRYGRKRAA